MVSGSIPSLPDSDDPYVLLGLQNASVEILSDGKAIKRAYKRMAMLYHPDMILDKNSSDEERKRAGDNFARINAAYETLGGRTGAVSQEKKSSAGFGGYWSGKVDPSAEHWRRNGTNGGHAAANQARQKKGSNYANEQKKRSTKTYSNQKPPTDYRSASYGSTWRNSSWNGSSSTYTADDAKYDSNAEAFDQIFNDFIKNERNKTESMEVKSHGAAIQELVNFLGMNNDGFTASSFSNPSSWNEGHTDVKEVTERMNDAINLSDQLQRKNDKFDQEILIITAEIRSNQVAYTRMNPSSSRSSKFQKEIELQDKLKKVKNKRRVTSTYLKLATDCALKLQERYRQLVIEKMPKDKQNKEANNHSKKNSNKSKENIQNNETKSDTTPTPFPQSIQEPVSNPKNPKQTKNQTNMSQNQYKNRVESRRGSSTGSSKTISIDKDIDINTCEKKEDKIEAENLKTTENAKYAEKNHEVSRGNNLKQEEDVETKKRRQTDEHDLNNKVGSNANEHFTSKQVHVTSHQCHDNFSAPDEALWYLITLADQEEVTGEMQDAIFLSKHLQKKMDDYNKEINSLQSQLMQSNDTTSQSYHMSMYTRFIDTRERIEEFSATKQVVSHYIKVSKDRAVKLQERQKHLASRGFTNNDGTAVDTNDESRSVLESCEDSPQPEDSYSQSGFSKTKGYADFFHRVKFNSRRRSSMRSKSGLNSTRRYEEVDSSDSNSVPSIPNLHSFSSPEKYLEYLLTKADESQVIQEMENLTSLSDQFQNKWDNFNSEISALKQEFKKAKEIASSNAGAPFQKGSFLREITLTSHLAEIEAKKKVVISFLKIVTNQALKLQERVKQLLYDDMKMEKTQEINNETREYNTTNPACSTSPSVASSNDVQSTGDNENDLLKREGFRSKRRSSFKFRSKDNSYFGSVNTSESAASRFHSRSETSPLFDDTTLPPENTMHPNIVNELPHQDYMTLDINIPHVQEGMSSSIPSTPNTGNDSPPPFFASHQTVAKKRDDTDQNKKDKTVSKKEGHGRDSWKRSRFRPGRGLFRKHGNRQNHIFQKDEGSMSDGSRSGQSWYQNMFSYFTEEETSETDPNSNDI